jgi:multisubunit Na+/H+ antiporter MnhB subunit
MDSSFGILDAFAFVVFAVLIVVVVIIFVSLGQLPGRLARKWDHPQASAVNVAGWIGMATGGAVAAGVDLGLPHSISIGRIKN